MADWGDYGNGHIDSRGRDVDVSPTGRILKEGDRIKPYNGMKVVSGKFQFKEEVIDGEACKVFECIEDGVVMSGLGDEYESPYLDMSNFKKVKMQCEVTSAAADPVTVEVSGSFDGKNYHDLEKPLPLPPARHKSDVEGYGLQEREEPMTPTTKPKEPTFATFSQVEVQAPEGWVQGKVLATYEHPESDDGHQYSVESKGRFFDCIPSQDIRWPASEEETELAFKVGDLVEVERANRWYKAKITTIQTQVMANVPYRIEFTDEWPTDGNFDWVGEEVLRKPELGFGEGDIVEANFKHHGWAPAKVKEIRDDNCLVNRYHAGNNEWSSVAVPFMFDKVRPRFKVGDKVLAREHITGPVWKDAVVIGVRTDRMAPYAVDFDAGYGGVWRRVSEVKSKDLHAEVADNALPPEEEWKPVPRPPLGKRRCFISVSVEDARRANEERIVPLDAKFLIDQREGPEIVELERVFTVEETFGEFTPPAYPKEFWESEPGLDGSAEAYVEAGWRNTAREEYRIWYHDFANRERTEDADVILTGWRLKHDPPRESYTLSFPNEFLLEPRR